MDSEKPRGTNGALKAAEKAQAAGTARLKARLQDIDFEDQVASKLVDCQDITLTISAMNLSILEFQEMASRPSFQDKLWSFVTARIIMPRLPSLAQAVMDKAMSKPSPVWTKMVLGMIGKGGATKTEEHKHVHISMSDEQLKARGMALISGMKDAVDLNMGEIKEVLERR